MNKSTTHEQSGYVSTFRKITFIPALITTVLGLVMMIDFYLPLETSLETLKETGKREVYETEEGHKFLSGYYTYYAFNDGEQCLIYHTPILHIVRMVGDDFEGNWDNYLVWDFYVWNAIYPHILFLLSAFVLLKRRFTTGRYYIAYLLLLFIGFMLYLMLWP